MVPLSLLAAQKVANLMTAGGALEQQIAALSAVSGVTLPNVAPSQIVLTSAPPNLSDDNMQLTYPRVCIYSSAIKNTKAEKFRSFSGTVAVVAEIWSSGDLVQPVDEWLHFYVEAYSSLLRQNVGDWGDGVFFSGVYDVQFQPAKAGGFGFVESAKVTNLLNLSLS
jgi:hypothetical protein